jgi:hypothetical protein
MPPPLTIAAAARLCQVDRRTLQRAIHAGRLRLDRQHGLRHRDLVAAGYLVEEAPPDTPLPAPQDTPQDTPHPGSGPGQALGATLADLTARLSALEQDVAELAEVVDALVDRELAGAPPFISTAPPSSGSGAGVTTDPASHASAPSRPAQPFDPAKYVLGKLCAQGHDWQGTGLSLRRLPSRNCPQCQAAAYQAKQAGRRHGARAPQEEGR